MPPAKVYLEDKYIIPVILCKPLLDRSEEQDLELSQSKNKHDVLVLAPVLTPQES